LLFKPNEDLSITAGALYQRLVMGGYDLVDVPPGPSYRAHYEAFNIPEPVTDTVHLYSLTVNWHLGFADLTSASSYWDRYEIQTQDASESIYNTLGGTVPLMPLPFSEVDPSHQFSQEIRLSSSGNDRLHWTGGAFFSNMTATWIDHGAGPGIPAPGGLFVESINPYNIKQSALFADGSYKFTDTLTLASGVRWYDYQSDPVYVGLHQPDPSTADDSVRDERRGPGLQSASQSVLRAEPDAQYLRHGLEGFPARGRKFLRAAAERAAALPRRLARVIRSGLGLELRDRREGEAAR
jgi:hypothetical protein